MGRRAQTSTSPTTNAAAVPVVNVKQLRPVPGTPIVCPQMIDPCIDVLAHCLIQRLRPEDIDSGIRRATCSLLATQRPVVMILSRESNGEDADGLLINLARLAALSGVPVVWALTREHLGTLCGSPRPVSAMSIMRLPDHHANELLHVMLKRAKKACDAWLAACEPNAA